MSELNFKWRMGDYGLEATPPRRVRFADEPNETIEFVKYYKNGGKEWKYAIGYFWWNDNEPCWELHFVGERFTDIPTEEIRPIWEILKSAYRTLDEWKRGQAEE